MKVFRNALVACTFVASQVVAGAAGAQAATDLNCAQCVGTSDIAAGAVNSAKIADGSIKSNDLSVNSVTTTQIKNNTVTFNKLSAGVKGALNSALANVTLERFYTADEGITFSDCPVDTIAVSASCACHDEGGAANYGMLGLCASYDVGAVAFCLIDGALFDPELPDPTAEVEAVCMGGTTTNGSPWVPLPPAPLFTGEGGSASDVDAQQIEWRRQAYEKYEAAIADGRKRVEIRRNRLSR